MMLSPSGSRRTLSTRSRSIEVGRSAGSVNRKASASELVTRRSRVTEKRSSTKLMSLNRSPAYSENSEPEVIGAAIQQFATPVTRSPSVTRTPTRASSARTPTRASSIRTPSRLSSRRTPTRSLTPMTGTTASSLPTRNTHTCGITKLCLASTVAPSKSAMTTKPVSKSSTKSRTYVPTKRGRGTSQFKTYKPPVSKSTTKYTVPVKTHSPSKSRQSSAFKTKTWGAKTCPGNTKGPWSPISRGGARPASRASSAGVSRASSRSRRSGERSRSRRSGESYVDVEDEIVYVDEEVPRKKNSWCSCFFWMLILLAVLLLIFLLLWFTIFQYWGADGKNDGNNNENQNDEVVYPPDGKTYEWSWTDTDGKTSKYSPIISWYIEQKNLAGHEQFLIDTGNDRMFKVDIRAKRQWSLKWNNGKGHTKSYATTKKFREMHRNEVTDAKQTKKLSYTPDHHWEWQHLTDKKWRPYSPQVSDFLAASLHYKGVTHAPLVDIGGDRLFKIEFDSDGKKGKQLSLSWNDGGWFSGGSVGHNSGSNGYTTTSKSRNIRRAPGPAPTGGNQRVRIGTTAGETGGAAGAPAAAGSAAAAGSKSAGWFWW